MTDNKRTCTYQRWDGKPCGRDLYDGEYCIFHSKDIEGKKDKFNDTFWKEFERQKEKEKKYDFNGFVFPGDISFKELEFEKDVFFIDAQFSGDANFEYAVFSGNTGYDEIQETKIVHRGNSILRIRADPECFQTSCKADFNNAKFYGQTNFKFATFHGCAEFKNVCFSEVKFDQVHFCNVSEFSYAKFKGEARFQDAVFRKDSSFFWAEFSKYTFFWGAELRGESNFENAKFYGVSVFEYAKFCNPPEHAESSESSKITSFLKAVFYGEALFNEAKFFGEAYFNQAVFNELASFRKTEFHKLSIFGYAKFNEDADFTGVIIENINSFNMQYTYFFNVIGLIEYIKENDKVFKPLRKISKTLKTEFVPDNFKIALGERAAAKYPVTNRQIKDDMYLLDKKERISEMSKIRKYCNSILYFLWWLFADYGRSFLRWTLWSILFLIIFAFIYHNIFYMSDVDSFYPDNIHDTWPGFSLIYYSIVTFTTLGSGDITPKPGCLQFWVAFEVILGYIMMGGLISILANKLARRS